MAHSSVTGHRRFRSSLLLLTWSLSCSGFCSSSDSKSCKLQRSARPPVKSTRASDTCPAHSRSYEPWSLKRIDWTLKIVCCWECLIRLLKLSKSATKKLVHSKSNWETRQGKSTGYLLGIGLLQQGYPKGGGGVAAWEARSGIDTGQAVVDCHLCPLSLLPKTKMEGAPVPAVIPLRLVWRHHLQKVTD